MTDIAQRLTRFYADINKDSIEQLGSIYAQNIEFIDPVRAHSGLSSLKTYFVNLLVSVTHCRFDIHSTDLIEDRLFIVWAMHYGHPRIANGKPLQLSGTSFLKVEAEKVVYQQDFYDMGAMIYEHVPVLGFVVKKLKSRL